MNLPIAEPPVRKQQDLNAHDEVMLALYRHMLTAREVDRLEEQYAARGEAFFQVSGSGHEAMAALAPHLGKQDWLHCHYRDKALMLARGMTPEMFFLALFCRDASHSRGRQMSAHMSWRAGNVLSLCGPVGNNALQAVGVAAEVKAQPDAPVVLCALGDGTAQQGEVMEAIAEAVRDTLPVLFLIEDNRYAISSRTAGRTFYSLPGGAAAEFMGVPIARLPGADAIACHAAFGAIVARMRAGRGPGIVVMDMERLSDHTHADDQRRYRSDEDIERAHCGADPVHTLHARLLARGVDARRLQSLQREVSEQVQGAARRARAAPDPAPGSALLPRTPATQREYRGQDGDRTLTMLAAIRETLRAHLASDPRVTLHGQDIEDPKGDVFGITSGLSTQFPGRVRNAPLAEATIVGSAIGRALAGGRPVALLQFADFLPLAFNQIAAELGSMHWRTDGAWRCPVIIMAPCGGYRPGLGPYHAQSLEALVAHMPGINVVMPSNAADAAGLLNAAFASETPTVFLYPKACLNERAQATSADIIRHRVPLGRARIERPGTDLTLVSYGNGMERCRRVAADLAAAGCQAELIDLRCVAPWDADTVAASVARTRRVLIVHEDNRTCGMGAEILATLTERVRPAFESRRVVREDTYVPCNYAAQLEVLPSYRRVLEAAAELMGFDVHWQADRDAAADECVVTALGSGPADESVLVTDLPVAPGELVREGQVVASVEATKSCVDIEAPCAGRVMALQAAVGDQVAVGSALVLLCPAEPAGAPRAAAAEMDAVARLQRRSPAQPLTAVRRADARLGAVGLSLPVAVTGSLALDNATLAGAFAGRGAQEVETLTGIRVRRRVAPGQDALSLGTLAARQALAAQGIDPDRLDLLICSTVTPPSASPSLACRILERLGAVQAQAYDISAACTGYLYALQLAHDHLTLRPGACALVVTADVLSPLLDPADFTTCAVFADAASATLVWGEDHAARFRHRLRRPHVRAAGDAGGILSVPGVGGGHIHMDGQKVFSEAVRRMSGALGATCEEHGVPATDLDWIVPHQANQRILDTVAKRLGIDKARVLSNLADTGNTSSSSIPLCLAQFDARLAGGQKLGLVAFGAGFTFGAALLDVP